MLLMCICNFSVGPHPVPFTVFCGYVSPFFLCVFKYHNHISGLLLNDGLITACQENS